VNWSAADQARRPRVLMVTGAYYPEVSGGGLQCQAIVKVLKEQIPFIILSVSTNAALPSVGEVDGVPVYRVAVVTNRRRSRLLVAIRLTRIFLRLQSRFDVVHFHGFSDKTILLTILAKLLHKRILLTLHTAGHDEPLSIRLKGSLAFWCYAQADRVAGVSPYMQERYLAAGLPSEKFQLIPGGVDLERFRPPSQEEGQRLRQALGLPAHLKLILFVGFFSHEKRPRLLFDAWVRLQREGVPPTGLVFVGATRSPYFEVDAELAETIRQEAGSLGLTDRLVFVEETHAIEQFYRSVDIFVLPSSRESMSMALVEAMASGLPCIASRLPGVTDRMIDHGTNGLLVPSGDADALEAALRFLLEHPGEARALGARARVRVEERYAITRTAAHYGEVYQPNGSLMAASA